MPLDDTLILINLKVDSVTPDNCSNRTDLDKHQDLLDKANEELVEYMHKELKGAKVKDGETVDFISHILRKISEGHVKIAMKRHAIDDSPYYSEELIIEEEEFANGYQLFSVSGKALFPKEIFNELARIWITEEPISKEEFNKRVGIVREKFQIEEDEETYFNLPFPKQAIIVFMLYANKVYGKINPREVNFLAEWTKRKLFKLGYHGEMGDDYYENFSSKI